jgi:ketosteroid isomerase-like protein
VTDQASDNVQFVGKVMDLIEREDRDSLVELIDGRVLPEAEFIPLIAIGHEGTYQGPEGVRRFLEDLLDAFEVRYSDREIRSIGDGDVLVLCRMELRGRESGAEIVTPVGTVYEFEGGQLRRGRVYEEQAAAQEAAEALAAAEHS